MGTSAPELDMSRQYPTNAMLGYTTLLEMGMGDVENPDYVDVGEVTDLTIWDASRDTVEVTNHRSPNFSLEYIPGLIDFGSCSFELNAVPRFIADPQHPQGQLWDLFSSAGNSPWRITTPDGTIFTFLGSLTSFNLTAPVKDVMKASCEISISGGVNFTPAAGGGGGGVQFDSGI